jgi:hypothetical protein
MRYLLSFLLCTSLFGNVTLEYPIQETSPANSSLDAAFKNLVIGSAQLPLPKPVKPELSTEGTNAYIAIGLLFNELRDNPANPLLRNKSEDIKRQLVNLLVNGKFAEFNYLAWLYLTYVPENDPVLAIVKNDVKTTVPIKEVLAWSLNRSSLITGLDALYGPNKYSALLSGVNVGPKVSSPNALNNISFLTKNYSLEYSEPVRLENFSAYLVSHNTKPNTGYLPVLATESPIVIQSQDYNNLKQSLLKQDAITTNGWITYILHTLTMLEKFNQQIRQPILVDIPGTKSALLDNMQAALKERSTAPIARDQTEPLVNKTPEFALSRVIPTIQANIRALIELKRLDEADFLILMYLNVFKANKVLIEDMKLKQSLGSLIDNTSITTLQLSIAKSKADSDVNLVAFKTAVDAKEKIDALQYLYNAYNLYPTNPKLYEIPAVQKRELLEIFKVLDKTPGEKLRNVLLELNNNVSSAVLPNS